MAKARRAKRRPARVVVPIILAALIGGIAVALSQGWFSGDTSTTASAPSMLATEQSASPAGSASSSTASDASASPSATKGAAAKGANTQTSSTQASARAQRALQKCRAKVRSRDAVLSAAKTGVGHWSEHVEAQTDRNSGGISAEKMSEIFGRTRGLGPGDVKRYQQAVDREDQLSGSCDAPRGASGAIRTKLASCAARSRAQQPALRAASNAMEDWKSHLAAMRRSRMGHVHDAQGVWIRAWQAAPPHIKQFRSAATTLREATDC